MPSCPAADAHPVRHVPLLSLNIDLRGQSFLWADDLGAFDSVLDLPFSIPFYGAHVSGFTILMAGSMLVYMRMTMANQSMPQQSACRT